MDLRLRFYKVPLVLKIAWVFSIFVLEIPNEGKGSYSGADPIRNTIKNSNHAFLFCGTLTYLVNLKQIYFDLPSCRVADLTKRTETTDGGRRILVVFIRTRIATITPNLIAAQTFLKCTAMVGIDLPNALLLWNY